jgi:DNA ligase-1
MELKRVMLAAKPGDLSQVKFPVLASPKLDGIRAVNVNGRLLSRTMKLIPNTYCQALFGRPEYHGLDGELVVGMPTEPNCMQRTSSGVMSFDGKPLVTWYIFDSWNSGQPFHRRLKYLRELPTLPYIVKVLPQIMIYNLTDLLAYENEILCDGYEGVIFRDPRAPYKQNRSTFREGGMVKLKRFSDSEAIITGVFELEHNDNEATYDERGFTKRSSAQEGKVGADTLGGFLVTDVSSGVNFSIGSGFTMAQRESYWKDAEALIGKIIKYKYFSIGVLDKPRHPIFLGFRDPIDM